jgi:hypothetical protein
MCVIFFMVLKVFGYHKQTKEVEIFSRYISFFLSNHVYFAQHLTKLKNIRSNSFIKYIYIFRFDVL